MQERGRARERVWRVLEEGGGGAGNAHAYSAVNVHGVVSGNANANASGANNTGVNKRLWEDADAHVEITRLWQERRMAWSLERT